MKQWDSHGTLAHQLSSGNAGQAGSPNQLMAPAANLSVSHPSPVSTFVLHSAFADPATTADAPDRESIEVRWFDASWSFDPAHPGLIR